MEVTYETAVGRPAAVHKLSCELGEFYGLGARFLRTGHRADLVVVDPAGLTDATKEYAQEPMVEFGGIKQMVNRNDDAVTATVIAGEYLYGRGVFASGFGTNPRSGQSLRADRLCGTVPHQPHRTKTSMAAG